MSALTAGRPWAAHQPGAARHSGMCAHAAAAASSGSSSRGAGQEHAGGLQQRFFRPHQRRLGQTKRGVLSAAEQRLVNGEDNDLYDDETDWQVAPAMPKQATGRSAQAQAQSNAPSPPQPPATPVQATPPRQPQVSEQSSRQLGASNRQQSAAFGGRAAPSQAAVKQPSSLNLPPQHRGLARPRPGEPVGRITGVADERELTQLLSRCGDRRH